MSGYGCVPAPCPPNATVHGAGVGDGTCECRTGFAGTPLWLDAHVPDADPSKPDRTLRRLMVSQDTGGAIRGPVRGDVFWGTGREAGEIAGRMKHQGRYWLLLPRDLDVQALVN